MAEPGASAQLCDDDSVRTRLLVALTAGLVLLVGLAGALAMWGGGPEPDDVVAVDVSGLERGRPRAIGLTLPGEGEREVRLLLTRQADGQVAAFVGKSTHLGCRLLVPGDPRYGDGMSVSDEAVTFQDPCGGSSFALDGSKSGGPAPRGLDSYAVELVDGHAQIDLTERIKGAAVRTATG